ncbi:MAG TPA: CoB--CoM heterodisulfide reductase iron-sulfur subunit A family protein [Candidatus Hydrogenedentes bacterium]|nr:CoB--CoM heterodisulfide reductase iron-sulfur subunit A family protein [Candidatus Hydrogenedentota bacterium]HPG65358.1 CoB--CoM heterodisulfide reductase iron-sulfur subunit A family protein [Candidatus Hydrogenedentota bacterium]
MARIGVFVCWCGENIARTVDVEKVTAAAAEMPGVRCAINYKYMCSDPGQASIREKIQSEKLRGVVVASCSPHMHLKTFRAAAQAAGLNPYLVEMANIREHCSWVHHNKDEATEKAIQLIRMTVGKVLRNHALNPIKVPLTKRALVIGGGVAGIQASLDIADAGYEVVLVEREPSIGGKMAGLSETFPTLDCSQCILTPRMVEVGQHPNIRLYSYSEVEAVDGYVGNFEVTIRKKARYVDIDKCTGCGDCWTKCPSKKNLSEFDQGMGTRTAIYVPFPQAVPARPVIDKEACLHFKTGKCGACQKRCQAGAINFEDEDQLVKENVGAVIIATGYKLYKITDAQNNAKYTGYGEYGYGQYPDVIDGLQFERIVSASGPTGGEIKRPSDGAEPKNIVFIACVGSRDNAKGMTFCSKICCMYTAKHTMLYKHKVHDGQAHVFYMDIRAGGKNYDEFVRRAIEKDGAKYYRGRVSKITQENGKLIVRGTDTLVGEPITVEADMVVLATAMQPADGARELAQKLKVGYDEFGFLSESHPKLRPVETTSAGVYICGACHAPKDIPEAVAQASAAAGKVQVMFGKGELTREPEIAVINEQTCAACYACVRTCPYGAIEKAEIRDRKGNLVKYTARVNQGLCMGCGTCVAVCPSKSADIEGFSEQQIYEMVKNLV